MLSLIQMRTELSLKLQHFGFLPHAFLTAQKAQLLPFQLYSCMRPMGMVMCLCEDMLVGAQEHVCAHARGSQMPASFIFFDNSPLYFLRQVLWTWNSAWAGWPASPMDLPASATSQGWLRDHSLLLAFYVVWEFQVKVLGFQSRHWAFPPVPPHRFSLAMENVSYPPFPSFGITQPQLSSFVEQARRLHLLTVLCHPRLFPGSHRLSL